MLFYLAMAVIFILTLLLKGSFLSMIVPDFIWPDLVLVMVIVLSFLMREKRGALIGFIGGMLQDILYAPMFGLFALSKMLMGICAGLVGREVYRDSIFGPVILVMAGTMLHEIIIYMLLSLFGEVTVMSWLVVRNTLYHAIFNTVTVLLVYPAMFWIYRQRGYLGIHID